MAANPLSFGRTKYFNVRIRFIRELVARRNGRVNSVDSENEVAKIITTKPLVNTLCFQALCTVLPWVAHELPDGNV